MTNIPKVEKYAGIAERLVRLRLVTAALSLTVKHDAAIAQTFGHSPFGLDCNRVRLELTRTGVKTALETARDLFSFLGADGERHELLALTSIIIEHLMATERPAADAKVDLTNEAAFSAISYMVERAQVLTAIALKLVAYDQEISRPKKPPQLSRVGAH